MHRDYFKTVYKAAASNNSVQRNDLPFPAASAPSLDPCTPSTEHRDQTPCLQGETPFDGVGCFIRAAVGALTLAGGRQCALFVVPQTVGGDTATAAPPLTAR